MEAQRPSGPEITPPARGSIRSTAATLAIFLGVSVALAVAPLPSWLKPLELRSPADAKRVAARVFAKPKMTLQHVEEKLAAGGGVDGRDAPEGQGIDAEERELWKKRDGRADVEALKDVPVSPSAPSRPAQARVAHVDRAAVVADARSPKADHFRAQARSVKAPGAAVEHPEALGAFFATLDAIAAGDDSARADVVVLGNSLIASDHVTDVVRARLVERFGSAGRGFLLPERLSKVAGRRVRTGEGTPGWDIETFIEDAPRDGSKLGPFGFTGSLHASSGPGERTTWKTRGADHARLFYLEHAGQPAMHLEARGTSGSLVVAKIEAIPKVSPVKTTDELVDVDLPAGTTALTLVAEGRDARVFGVALEADHGGVMVDTIGVPAASAKLYVDGSDADIFERQIAQREPALYTVMLGGNETRSLSYGTLDPPTFEKALTELVQRLKTAAPSASCLLVAPIDAVKATAAGEELRTRPQIYEVMKVQRAVAEREGCAYFDLFSAMGGSGALTRFRDHGMLSEDLVHPTWRGGDVLGQLFADALLDAYVKTPAQSDAVVVSRRKSARVRAPVYAGLSFPSEERPAVVIKGKDAPPPKKRALGRFFKKLRALEDGDVDTLTDGHVTIGQLGASHTAGQMWTDRMRRRLGARFGVAGRGFVSVERRSRRLEAGGVSRSLSGPFEIADGREVVLGGAVGMSGTKARLEPGAQFSISFCNPVPSSIGKREAPFGCAPSTGTLQIAWLYTPDMGIADVAVDGKTVAAISPDDRDPTSDVQFLKLPIDGTLASVEIDVRGDRARPLSPVADARSGRGAGGEGGPVHLLSVVEERDRPGIVFDAVGLPGTTGMTPQRWRQDLLGAEVHARHYDLVVTAWGTNEAGIRSLDDATYRYHFEKTLRTLLAASPGADCLIIGASDRLDDKNGVWKRAPAHDLVERVQRRVAAAEGCAFFSLRTAMGGPGSMDKWVAAGLGNADHVHFTRKGYEKLADLVIDDLMAAYAYDSALEEVDAAALADDDDGQGGQSGQAGQGGQRASLVDRRGG